MLHMSRAMAHFMLLCTHFGTLRPSALCSTVLEPSVPQSTVLRAQRASQRTVLQVQRRTAHWVSQKCTILNLKLTSLFANNFNPLKLRVQAIAHAKLRISVIGKLNHLSIFHIWDVGFRLSRRAWVDRRSTQGQNLIGRRHVADLVQEVFTVRHFGHVWQYCNELVQNYWM